jgi:hypothetical protein
VGGNLIDFPGDVSTTTADPTTEKLVVNHTLSTTNAKYMCGDIKNSYMGTPLERYEYMRLPLAILPQEIIEAYNLNDIAHNGNIYVEIHRGMYGLPQAGIIVNQLLTKRLQPHGYYQCRHIPGLWRHRWRPILFSLVVDDFGISYVGKQHADHLIQAIENDYDFTKDWSGTLYCGITIQRDYINRTATLSMPGYIKAALHKYQHSKPMKRQYSPHIHNTITYGAQQQLPTPEDQTDPASEPQKKRIQKITGTLLLYARAVDPTMLMPLSTIATAQSIVTQHTIHATNQILDYCATHPDATITYRASDMILKILHSDASYMAEEEDTTT